MAVGHGHVGISCRRLESSRTFTEYHLLIGADGSYNIEGGPPYRPLASGTETSVMRAGTNHIRGDCIGTTLTLYANGQRIATAEDSQLTGRLSGIFLRSLDATGTSMNVRNLLITAP